MLNNQFITVTKETISQAQIPEPSGCYGRPPRTRTRLIPVVCAALRSWLRTGGRAGVSASRLTNDEAKGPTAFQFRGLNRSRKCIQFTEHVWFMGTFLSLSVWWVAVGRVVCMQRWDWLLLPELSFFYLLSSLPESRFHYSRERNNLGVVYILMPGLVAYLRNQRLNTCSF